MLSQTDIQKILASAMTQKQKLAITEAIITAVDESKKDMATLKDLEVLTANNRANMEEVGNRTQKTVMWAAGFILGAIALAVTVLIKYG